MVISNFVSNVHPKRAFGLVLASVIFVLSSFPGLCQTPELFEDKILINNIATPWGFTFINSNEVLFTEKQGKLFRYDISNNTRTEITGLPAILLFEQGGLLDVALHPNFSTNSYVYLTYTVSASGGQTTALGRGTLVGNRLQNFTELFRALPISSNGSHFGSRIVFDRNNLLYMSVGDRGTANHAQNRNNHLGKVLRFNDDGTVPTSNPLVGVPDTKPEIYSWGHRNIQGMAMNPATGDIYANEHGPKGGDELNLIKPNTNYGWPAVTFGIDYDGSVISSDTTRPGMELPLTYWVPSIAPSGMAFLWSGQPDNEADILIGALAGTHIHWLKMRDNKRVSSTRSMNGYARFRDVRQAPDGKLYAMTETPNRFVLLRSSVPILNVVVRNLIYDSKNATNSLGIYSNRTWNVNSDSPWCKTDKLQGRNNDSLRLTVDENKSTVERAATVMITATGLPTQRVTVRQNGAAAVLSVSTNTLTFAAKDSTRILNVFSNTGWNSASSSPWCKTNMAQGQNNDSLRVSVEENKATSERVATITVSSAGLSTQRVTIRQERAPAVLTTNTNEINFDYGDSSTVVQVRSNVSWSVTMVPDWITVTPLSGISDENMSVAVKENISSVSRTAGIIIRGSDVADIVVQINQENDISSSVSDGLLDETEYFIFPNPSDDKIHLELNRPTSDVYSVTILSYSGKIVIATSLLEVQKGIDVSQLPEGIYFLQMTDTLNRTVVTKKFMKK